MISNIFYMKVKGVKKGFKFPKMKGLENYMWIKQMEI